MTAELFSSAAPRFRRPSTTWTAAANYLGSRCAGTGAMGAPHDMGCSKNSFYPCVCWARSRALRAISSFGFQKSSTFPQPAGVPFVSGDFSRSETLRRSAWVVDPLRLSCLSPGLSHDVILPRGPGPAPRRSEEVQELSGGPEPCRGWAKATAAASS
jgi:hypothetical protein